MAAAADANIFFFRTMNEAELRQWVEANPGRVDDRDLAGDTPLIMAASRKEGLSMVVWLLDEKGADVNATLANGYTPLHNAKTPDILSALLDRGADPILPDRDGELPLMSQAQYGTADVVARLLQDPRVRATIDVQDENGRTALHHACMCDDTNAATYGVHYLLQAGANPTLTKKNGQTPMAWVRQHHPTNDAVIALVEQASAEAEKTSLLVKARRLAVAASSNVVAPSYLQARVAGGQCFPRVALAPLTDGQNEGEEEKGEGEEHRKLRTTLAFMCGLGREGMPRDVFRVVMDLLMPSWDPLRRKDAGAGQPLPQG